MTDVAEVAFDVPTEDQYNKMSIFIKTGKRNLLSFGIGKIFFSSARKNPLVILLFFIDGKIP